MRSCREATLTLNISDLSNKNQEVNLDESNGKRLVSEKNWTLDIQNMSWVEDTNRQVDFLIKQLHLKGTEKILDLACGFGRHSLEFARRGYDVTGIDITPAYIDYGMQEKRDLHYLLLNGRRIEKR